MPPQDAPSDPTPRSSIGATAREVTPRAIVLGILVGLIMSVANVYLGLFAGMTVRASIPAAVISMGVLRSGLFKGGTILENNIVQTIASAGESLAAGIIFTMPALVIAGVWTDFDFLVTTLVAITGGMLGVLFMIPLRKPMIVENDELIYPEGVACAKVLDAGESGGSGMRTVFSALAAGALLKLLMDAFHVIGDSVSATINLGKAKIFGGLFAAPALVGVGYIVGLQISLLVFAGGALSWIVAAPLMTMAGYQGASAADPELYSLLKPNLRFLGVGAMIVGGLWSILQIRKGIVQGLRETVGGYRASSQGTASTVRTEQDMEARWVLLLLAATAVAVLGLYHHVTGGLGVSVLATVLMVVCSFFFVAVAAYIVGLVGSSNSPVSGMTICAVLFTSAFLFLFGFRGDVAILATLGVAGVVCCATCTSGDVCQDLKTGALVGATPKRQQWMEVIGVITAAFVMQPVLRLLHTAYGIGTDAHLAPEDQGQALEAPQAGLFASLMQGFFGDAPLPWDLIGWGAALGVAIVAGDQLLKARGSSVRLHIMPVAVGMYLPFGLSTAILAGGLLNWLATSPSRGGTEGTRQAGYERGVLLASGLIAGEAIAGVLIAVPKAMEVPLPAGIESELVRGVLAGAMLLGVAGWFLRVSKPAAD
ncbi:MAG: oligopeptide transporter, OPT family [Planctomycetota bacterium]